MGNAHTWKCHCMFYRLQNEAVLRGKHPSYQQRRCAMNCGTANLQGKYFQEIFFLGSWGFLEWFGMTKSDPSRNEWQLIYSPQTEKCSTLSFFCSGRIPMRVIQCDEVSEWQNAPEMLKDTRKSTLNLSVPAITPDEEQLPPPWGSNSLH